MTLAHDQDGGAGLYIRTAAANIIDKQSRKPTKGGPVARR